MEREGETLACLSLARPIFFMRLPRRLDISQHVDLAWDLFKALDVFQQFEINKTTVVYLSHFVANCVIALQMIVRFKKHPPLLAAMFGCGSSKSSCVFAHGRRSHSMVCQRQSNGTHSVTPSSLVYSLNLKHRARAEESNLL